MAQRVSLGLEALPVELTELASLETFGQMQVTKQEWEDYDESIDALRRAIAVLQCVERFDIEP